MEKTNKIQLLRRLSLILDVSGTTIVMNNTKLYTGSYRFVGLQAYVPITQNRDAGTNPLCTVRAVYIDNSGVRRQAGDKFYNMVYSETVRIGGFDYLLFEREFPKQFTDNAGDLEIVLNYSEVIPPDMENNIPAKLSSRMPTNIFQTVVSDGGVADGDIDVDLTSAESAQINANTLAIQGVLDEFGAIQDEFEEIQESESTRQTNEAQRQANETERQEIFSEMQLSITDYTAREQIAGLDAEIEEINEKIPNQASAENQLADKEFVNSSISNMAANYVTSSTAGDAQWVSFAALQAGPWYNRGAVYTPSRNDYAIYTETDGSTWRATFDGVQWDKTFKVNDTPFTSAQLAALNSGITASGVALIHTHGNKAFLDTLTALKTIGNQSLIGSGNITPSQIGAQATLISGSNIKTLNGESLLGSGNLVVSGGGGGNKYLVVASYSYDDGSGGLWFAFSMTLSFIPSVGQISGIIENELGGRYPVSGMFMPDGASLRSGVAMIQADPGGLSAWVFGGDIGVAQVSVHPDYVVIQAYQI